MNSKPNTSPSLKHEAGRPRYELREAFWANKDIFLSVILFSMIANLLMLTGPMFMLQVYDRVLSSGSIPTLIALTGLVAGLYAFLGLFEHIRARVLARAGIRIDCHLQERIFGVWLKQALLGRMANQSKPLQDLANIRQFLSSPGLLSLFDVPWVPIYLAVIFSLHWILGLVAIVGGIISLCLALLIELRSKDPLQQSMQQQAISQAFSGHGQRSAAVIQAMGMETNIRRHWQQSHTRMLEQSLVASDRTGSLSTLSKTFRLFLQSAILAAGAWLAVLEQVTPGTMIAASILMGRALAPIDQSIAQWKAFVGTRQAWVKLSKLLNTIPKEQPKTKLPTPTGHLRLSSVFAGAPGMERPILKNISFELHPGDGLGIIGPSASGKSSLANLLVGIWLPASGSVRLNGADYSQWNNEDLGPYIGYLPQGVELIDGTIAQNIARFDPETSDDTIVKAAKAAGIHDLILEFPDGYETIIGEGRTLLSGGQRQRIALARALYRDPVLVVLDEPNANLDADGDAALTNAIVGLRERGAVVVVIAHRPSAIAGVNKVLMLNGGNQQAFGPKEEVLREVTKIASVSGG